ncbi:MAG: sigma-70 family RNA polymerase sigma factor [Planctomycetaceae bacterium]|nr:sigma-70 family RNA polymerase sigma factor [Planctomycetaceae bacterium]
MNSVSESSRIEDARLWQRVLADERAAFEHVVAKYQNLVASVAYSATGNFSLSEEVTQETFWQAWRQRFQLREPEQLAAWLCGMARNMACQTSKKELRHSATELTDVSASNVDDPAHNSISEEERQLVWSTLETIPETNREALVLFYREGQSMAEVAAALGVSIDVAKQRVHRGRDLLRATLASRVEDVLVRSRPSRVLTARVMVGLAALTASLKATASASAATVGTFTIAEVTKSATVSTAGGMAATAVKSAVMTGASTGLIGGLIGAAGGLGGAFLGCWLPSQLAETVAERDLLARQGRKAFAVALVFTLSLLLITPLLLIPGGALWYFVTFAGIMFTFVVVVLRQGLKSQAELKQLRCDLPIDAELNPSPLRRKLGWNKAVYRGKCYTSQFKLLGVPIIDVQFNDVFASGKNGPPLPKHAFGWIAVGDRATGLLFAAGGIAKGLIAIGGLAIGGVAFGGLALGGFAIGGGALGWMAFGGGAIGYEAVGGLAIAWHVATGGAALAYHLAVGGGAWAHDFAVGGGAFAAEANTEAAKKLAESDSKMWLLESLAKNQPAFIAITLVISFLPGFLLRYAYRKENRD